MRGALFGRFGRLRSALGIDSMQIGLKQEFITGYGSRTFIKKAHHTTCSTFFP